MTEFGPEFSIATAKSLSRISNLQPSSWRVAVDPTMSVKARWTAFDTVYEAYVDEMRERGFPMEDALGALATEDSEFRIRRMAALTMIQIACGGDRAALNHALVEVETLVPTPPDPATGSPQMSTRDQAILNVATRVLAEGFPDEWGCFFRKDSESVERRRSAFEVLYGAVSGVWREQSLFAQSLSSAERQRWVIMGLICHVPRDQWTTADVDALAEELTPVREPEEWLGEDWNRS